MVTVSGSRGEGSWRRRSRSTGTSLLCRAPVTRRGVLGEARYPGRVIATTLTPAFVAVFSIFVVATIVLVVLTVRFVLRRDRERRGRT